MRLAADAAHQFGGIELDRSKPVSFRLDGRTISGFAGDTVLSAVLASGIETFGSYGGGQLGLSEDFAPLVTNRRGDALPMDRTPALDRLDLATVGRRDRPPFGKTRSLHHVLGPATDSEWLRTSPQATLTADLLIVGAGVAGLAAAKSAVMAGRSVILAERRPWFGGDARYFGAIGDEETPEALVARLVERISGDPLTTLLLRTEILAMRGQSAIAHQVEIIDGTPRGRVLRIDAGRILLATGATQRLPVFPGNRLPSVIPAIAAYHQAKRYGVAHGATAIVATQGNHGYRLALRLHDAGVAVARIVDTRIHPQSRFVDFAKATGLTLASGQFPLAAGSGRFSFANNGTEAAVIRLEASQLIVTGGWQPNLSLWMQAGGSVQWTAPRGALLASGDLAHIALAGSAAGYVSMLACADSGRAAQAMLFGETRDSIADGETGTALETPDAPTPNAPASSEMLSFLSSGSSLANRLAGSQEHTLSLGDVAASVELGLIAASDAGAIAEERGAPGADLTASGWRPAGPSAGDETPAYLVKRFGDNPRRVHLIVDGKRQFDIGTLVYQAGTKPDPERAIGVVVEAAPIGGIALVRSSAARLDRFVLETLSGPSPARIAKD